MELVVIFFNIYGLEVNKYLLKRKSFFYYVVKKGFLDIVKFLIDKNVFINIFDEEERMFLYWVF